MNISYVYTLIALIVTFVATKLLMKKSFDSIEYEPFVTALISGCVTYYYFNFYTSKTTNTIVNTNPSMVKPNPATNLERINSEPFPN